MSSDNLELTLKFHLSADPVAGIVRDRTGGSEPFIGWIALTRAIEAALDNARHRDTPHQDPGVER